MPRARLIPPHHVTSGALAARVVTVREIAALSQASGDNELRRPQIGLPSWAVAPKAQRRLSKTFVCQTQSAAVSLDVTTPYAPVGRKSVYL